MKYKYYIYFFDIDEEIESEEIIKFLNKGDIILFEDEHYQVDYTEIDFPNFKFVLNVKEI